MKYNFGKIFFVLVFLVLSVGSLSKGKYWEYTLTGKATLDDKVLINQKITVKFKNTTDTILTDSEGNYSYTYGWGTPCVSGVKGQARRWQIQRKNRKPKYLYFYYHGSYIKLRNNPEKLPDAGDKKLLALTFNSKGQNKNFSLSLSTYNHAEQIFNGRTTYIIKNNMLTIRRSYMFSKNDTVLLSQKLDLKALERIMLVRLDGLKDFYFNYCVMSTSGTEFFISTTFNKVKKNISLHHYYNEQIEKFIFELNKNIPGNLKIDYVPKDTKQDCKI